MAEENTQQQQQQPPFDIKKIYLKDASLESPCSPDVFTRPFQPQINVEFDNTSTKLEGQENIYEVVIRVTVTCKQDDKVTYLCEIKQAGVFMINLPEQDQVDHVLNVLTPTIIFPYASETVNNLITRAGFLGITIPPVNFALLYAQRLAPAQHTKQETK